MTTGNDDDSDGNDDDADIIQYKSPSIFARMTSCCGDSSRNNIGGNNQLGDDDDRLHQIPGTSIGIDGEDSDDGTLFGNDDSNNNNSKNNKKIGASVQLDDEEDEL